MGFDTLAEGLMLIDNDGDIVHANQAFCQMINIDADEIVGSKADELEWGFTKENEAEEFPWNQCIIDQDSICGEIIEFKTAAGFDP